MRKTDHLLHVWELALIFSLCAAILTGAWAEGRQAKLSQQLVRLHVVAASDSACDQAEKLRVRDAILELLSPKLAAAKSASEAAQIIRASKQECRLAAQRETAKPVRVTLETEHFPTRDYDGFSLPAGDYLALRVTLGAGQGHNWWCVLFPPLCTDSAISERAVETLSNDDMRLITADGRDYILRFRVLEWWDTVKTWLKDSPS